VEGQGEDEAELILAVLVPASAHSGPEREQHYDSEPCGIKIFGFADSHAGSELDRTKTNFQSPICSDS
jgi:hypothetical protein